MQCSEQDQFNGLDTFQLLLEESTANRAACVRAGLLSLLLDWFAQEPKESLNLKIGNLMQMIGGHSISGKDMRCIFALLRSSKDGFRPRHGTLLLRIFQGMLKEQGPAVFFDLSGRDAVSDLHFWFYSIYFNFLSIFPLFMQNLKILQTCNVVELCNSFECCGIYSFSLVSPTFWLQ